MVCWHRRLNARTDLPQLCHKIDPRGPWEWVEATIPEALMAHMAPDEKAWVEQCGTQVAGHFWWIGGHGPDGMEYRYLLECSALDFSKSDLEKSSSKVRRFELKEDDDLWTNFSQGLVRKIRGL